MRVRRIVAVLLVALLMALPLPARAEALDKPLLTPGDYWIYATNTSFESGLELRGQVTSAVKARETTTVLNVSLDVVRIVVNGSGTVSGQVSSPFGTGAVSGTWIVMGEERLEADQLKVVSDLLDVSVDGLFRGIVTFSLRATNTTLYRILADDWRFPLTVGGNGSVTTAYAYTQDFIAFGNQSHATGSGNFTTRYSLAAGTTVSTPAGSFLAYPVRAARPDGSTDVGYYSPEVGNDVRTESYNETGTLLSTTVLRSFRYQALEPPTFLGLSLLQWGIVGVVVAGVVSVGFILWRRSRKRRVLPPSIREPPA